MSPTGMNVRELKAHLDAIPDEYLNLEVVVMLRPDGEPEDGFLTPGVITSVEQLPAMARDPQPTPVVFHIYAGEGTSTAAMVEAMGTYQRFLDREV